MYIYREINIAPPTHPGSWRPEGPPKKRFLIITGASRSHDSGKRSQGPDRLTDRRPSHCPGSASAAAWNNISSDESSREHAHQGESTFLNPPCQCACLQTHRYTVSLSFLI